VPEGAEVTERVLEHDRPERHRIRFGDPEAEGELSVSFRPSDEGAVVRQELAYELRRRGLFARIADLLFVRSQMRLSLQRSLTAFAAEVEERSGSGL
jgi:hypothetical protein